MASDLTATASAEVDASAADVFDYVCQPANHAAISGDESVQGERHGPERLSAVGDKFGMSMKMYGLPYRLTNTVKEYDEGRLIAWCHPGRHRWRWELEELGDDRCRVTETFDMSTSPIKPALRLMGYPNGHQDNVEKSVANVAAQFA